MEQILRNRVKLRYEQVKELCVKASYVRSRSQTETLTMQEVLEIRNKLVTSIDNFQKEIQKLTECAPDLDLRELDTYTMEQMKAEELIAELEALEQVSKLAGYSSEPQTQSTTKLPKLQLPKFNGDPLNWHQFWDRFESAIDKSNLSDADKLVYLMGCLEGPAYDKLSGLSITNSNYKVAVTLFKTKYSSKNKEIDSHYQAIAKIKPASNNANDCRLTLDGIEKHMRILQSLGEDVNANHFRVTLSTKFPDNVLYQVNLQTPGDYSTEVMLKNLDIVITAMEKSNSKEENKDSATVETLHVVQRKGIRDKKFKMKGSNGRKRKSETATSDSATKRKKLSCIFCESPHYNDKCNVVTTVPDRMKKLKGRCYNCFRKGHLTKECKMNKKCVYCQNKHNRALCPKMVTSSKDDSHIKENDELSGCCLATNPSVSYLQTATTMLRNNNSNQDIQCRLLLDSGSQRSYISSRMANILNLSADKEDLLLIYTFGMEKAKEICSPSAEIMLKTKRNVGRKLRVNVVPHITERVPVPNLQTSEDIDIVADDANAGEGIDLLIGNDYYFSFIRNEYIHKGDNLYLINTDFGWIVSGDTTTENDHTLSVITYCQCHEAECPYFTEPDLPLRTIDMKFLWSLESIGITDSPKVSQQEEAVKFYNSTVKYECGRYYVKWPWVQYPPDLPTNYGLAYGRLKSLLRRLDKETLEEYDQILKEQLEAGIIEIVKPETSRSQQTVPPIHYLPHHIVKQEGKRGRIVYDASAKVKEQKSLNEGMFKGPSMLEDLTALILKFRTGKIGIVGDVEKAFLQIGLQEEDRDVTRFLWVKKAEEELTDDNLIHFRFCRVPFGIISSPFLLTATIRHHISRTNETLLKKIADRCYVDNLVTNADTVEEAIELYSETREVFEGLGMNIREWASNSQEFVDKVPEKFRAGPKTNIKLLGLMWNLKDDTLVIKPNNTAFKGDATSKNITKREVLKTLARLYDPCGYAAPLILPAKLLFQDLCTRKIKWDSELPEELLETWNNALENLQSADEIQIPRYVGHYEAKKEDVKYDLHCFTDASKNAYAAVVYLLAYYQDRPKVTFIMSKARITPIEDKDDLKIPRLELLGYLIGNRLLRYVKNSLDLTIEKQYLWTDSLIVLNWMRSNKLLPPFVLRRINEIKQNAGVDHCYINTNDNPADLATRPELWQLKKDLWFNGPKFLKENRSEWPSSMHIHIREPQTILLAGEALDIVDGPEMVSKGYENEEDNTWEENEYVANEDTTLDVRASAETLDESLLTIKKLQNQYFKEETEGKVTHLTRNLGLFLDVDGVLRCRGRITHSDLPYETKYPAIIPKDSPFTEAIVKHTHEVNYHVGTSHTLSILRQKYWIPQGRATVQKILKKCPQCVKHGGGPYKLPATPALPPERVRYSTPFTYTGIDYFGPLAVATDEGKGKHWVCLFTCLAVRAIHLEVVKDLTAAECLLAVRRFVASRGLPHMITSDNALTFKLTSEVLSSPYCVENKIVWKFIPQLAPWHGGFYERLVALVKHCLKRTLEKHLLSESQLQTVMKEVEAVINTRPLTYVGNEPEAVLRPCDFLTLGKCLDMGPLQENTSEGTLIKVDLVKSWKKGQRIVNEFKNMFILQYLTSLRERYQHSSKQPRVTSGKSPRVGDIVQIKDASKNRHNWKVGRIASLIKGVDGECRVAKVKVGETEFTRSIGHLYPLEDDVTNECTSTKYTQLPRQADEVGIEEVNETGSNEQSAMEVDVPQDLPSTIEVPQEQDNVCDLTRQMEDIEMMTDSTPNDVLADTVPPCDPGVSSDTITENDDVPVMDDGKIRRLAAIRARERIAEWTQQLCTLLH